MSSSNALICWDPVANSAVATVPQNSRPEGGRWALVLNALLSPSPGRTLDHVYTSIGKVLETQANRAAHTLGLGPHIVAGKIKVYFGDGKERVRQLELLRTTIPTKLEKKCLKLMKYTLPTEAANTQSQAFKEIVDLVTMFPGLRVLFLHATPLANTTSLDTIFALWDRSTGAPDTEWTFWKTLAATCMTDATVSTILEATSVAEFGKCDEEGLGVIEQLLIEHDCTSSEYSTALCVRYLAGVLDLPRFWLNMESVHAHVANKICCRLGQMLKDMGVDIPALGPTDELENPFDYDGVDHLATMLLDGISDWFTKIKQEDWAVQQWYESFTKLLQLLRVPRAAELLPHTYDFASKAFENILPTTYQDTELQLMVDSKKADPEDQILLQDSHLTDLQCENMSTPSLHNNTGNEDDDQSVHCIDEAESQHSDRDSGELSTEDDRISEMTDLSDPEAIPMDSASDISTEWEGPSGPDVGYNADVFPNLNSANTAIQKISGGQGVLDMTSYPSLADQKKILVERKTILHQKQRDLGDNHLETLDAMESLAWVQHELGEYKPASDLRAVVLEKRIILLGNDDPLTLDAMLALGVAYQALGQYKEAENLLLSALDQQKEVLGEHHPGTLRTTINLALVYQSLGQQKRAEDLQIYALEKQRDLFGENNVDTLRTMRDLAITYDNQGQYNKARELYTSALEKYRDILGEDHPNTLETMSRLGAIYRELGWHEESEQLYRIVLPKRKILLGEDHPDTLRATVDLALGYTRSGQLETAEGLLLPVLNKLNELLGEDHPYTLVTMGRLVDTYCQFSQFKAAQELALVALEKQRKLVGETHPNTQWIMGNLALTYQMQGNFEHAEELYVVLFQRQRKLLGDDHPGTRWVIGNLADTYRKLDKLREAKELEDLLEATRAG